MTREESLNKIGELVVYARAQGWDEEFTEAFETLSAEPCEDCISRQAVLDTMSELNAISFYEAQEDSNECYHELRKAMEQLPSVTPQTKMGKWIVNEWGNISCSECGCTALYDKVYPGESVFGKAVRVKSTFCPTCGARMVEPQKSEVKE